MPFIFSAGSYRLIVFHMMPAIFVGDGVVGSRTKQLYGGSEVESRRLGAYSMDLIPARHQKAWKFLFIAIQHIDSQ